MLEKDKILMEIKTEIAELHNSILTLSAGLWNISIAIDQMFLEDNKQPTMEEDYDRWVENITRQSELKKEVGQYGNDEPIQITHDDEQRANEMYQEQMEYEKQMEEQPVIKARGRPRKESPAEPQKAPVEPEVPPTLPPLPPLPKSAEQPKPNIVERLLGKDADQKAKLRAERMAKLEKELAELSKK